MKHSATSSEAHARASWPLPEPTLAYFPNAWFVASDRDLGAGAAFLRAVPRSDVSLETRGGVAVADKPNDLGPNGFGHVPVLLERCVELLTPALTRQHADGSGAVLVDATLGAGGHAERFLTELPGLRLIGLDRDPSALDIAGARLAPFADRITLVHTRYDGIRDALAESGYAANESIDGALFDLGVSSMQLDRAERGFAYAQDAPLDMRMDPSSPLTAADIVNTYDEAELANILHRYGEERFARRIATHIVRQRARTPLRSTAELVALLYQAIPAPGRRTGGHPAKRTFQALRIAVNDELSSLRSAIPAAMDALTVAGRIAVMAYQSLEDRIVKRVFADAVASGTPVDLPFELPGRGPRFRSLTRGAERADEDEIERNPRSAAVRLRALQRLEHEGHAQQRVTKKGDS
ncbi:16S rRNA (cytosine(1402)-N(4))-methyltransferase RsmH [Mycobacterium montefiorense]|uniref:16S rRNA (cytosine(1402)-N(4))-methyltransferase RsmH n=1 Tax=Mycobacterium montefiorense TaxID=154654 RepID=UPI0021F29136|nr:16S rRNA (cytosine(1402)-N(4))-methyltransferase RsmH [Mycobacterium montefiorense]MCV7425382.1 16S rRNA (cytosine(1402)-N(4))-methyltransferase RsmH [Mycobacterium montefiorense]